MSLKGRLRRLERDAEEGMIVVTQKDGTTARFPRSAGVDAFFNFMERLGAGEDAPPEHPLILAARNSDEPKWSGSFYAIHDPDDWVRPIEDLSE